MDTLASVSEIFGYLSIVAFQESLGGNAKTSLVVAASDVREHAEETQQSLQFGSRAMCVKTHPVINEQIDYQ